MKKFKGTGVALVTPFQASGAIDYPALERVVEHVILGNVDYLVVQGTTGESATLSETEKLEVLAFIKKINRQRLPIVYGLGGNNTQAVLAAMDEIDFSEIDAILSVSPYYNKPSQTGIIAHYEAIADRCPVPVILYNVPGRTMSNLNHQTTLQLAQHPNIIGIKEASGNLDQCMRIARDKPDDFLLISGDDMSTTPMRSIGAVGVISVMANAYPEIIGSIIHGNDTYSKKGTFSLLDINPLMYEESNPVGVKCLMQILGLCDDFVRLPLVSASEDLKNRIKATAAAVNTRLFYSPHLE
ncbi:4-hydroxy-tetrahydrodipicolinate synthase [Cyclobacterium xiamenense]|uniref:4-hydroxy-tetrahydrodipicolinate synthase n=1 Tax=Cyclobacterium xiamenense TaxID=1297121 RepID=UPI0012B80F48|nr:4-hydroxy-tetrahydrodipicolinate synthase [Cyclobacterium xiamenense]